jgi:hypothetical protein
MSRYSGQYPSNAVQGIRRVTHFDCESEQRKLLRGPRYGKKLPNLFRREVFHFRLLLFRKLAPLARILENHSLHFRVIQRG